MRCAEINKTPFTYANFKENTPILDANGLKTGQYTPSYDTAVSASGNISPSGGQVYAEIFGLQTGYTNVIVMDDPSFPMKEDAILWIGIASTEPHNYVVRKRAPSKNFIAYAIQEVTVNA